MNKIILRLLRFFRNFFNIYLAIVILLLIFVAPFLGFTYKRLWANYNIIFFISALLFGFISVKFVNNILNKKPKIRKILTSNNFYSKFLIVGSIILLAIQFWIVNGGWFIVGWDTRDVIFPDKQMNFDYMSMYPNQLMLAGIFRRIYFFLTNTFSFSFDQYYLFLCFLSTIAVWLSVIFVSLITKKLTNNLCGIASFILAFIFLGLSPWIMVPYSDTFALFCTSFILLIYISKIWNPIKWFLICFAAIFGIGIKPTVAAVFLSIIFIELISFIFKFVNKNKKTDTNGYTNSTKKSLLEKLSNKIFKSTNNNKNYSIKKFKINIKKLILTSLFIIVAFVSATTIVNKISDYGVKIDENRSFTFTHFLMMGINIENKAAWNNDDVSISRSYENSVDRSIGNLKQYAFRFKVLWPAGVFNIYLNKTLTNYSDGTFSWNAEKPWAIEWKGDNKIVHTFYGYTDNKLQDDNKQYFAYIWQSIWFFILIGCVLTIINQKPSKKEIVICCSILAISAFLTLCEPDSRYIILYLSLFCIQSTKGWYLLAKSLRNKLKTTN